LFNETFPFFNEHCGTTIFHVDQVYHEFSGDLQQINLMLETGTYNSYLKMRTELAFETGELNYVDTQNKSQSRLDKC